MSNRVTQLLAIRFPIIQAGMVWCSGHQLATAVSNAGGLGVIGSGSMYPEVLDAHIAKTKQAVRTPYGVNVPLLYPDLERHIECIIDHEVPVVITSAGNPELHTKRLQNAGCTVGHVVSSSRFAVKAEKAGVDFIIAEGFEAGGHNGREETTTLVLVPQVVDAVSVPVVAAGGIGDGRSMFAALALGAEGVQIGSRFVATHESSAHANFKNAVARAGEGSTQLTLKELTPVRLLEGGFLEQVRAAYTAGWSPEQLRELLGKGRAKRGMFEGDLEEGELEIGQIAGRIDNIEPAAMVVASIISQYRALGAPNLGGRFSF